MRHRKSGVKLGRTGSHRKAMFQNMTNSLFEHELIKTTLPKAKELRRVAEPLITMAKEDSVANRRLAFSRMRSKAYGRQIIWHVRSSLPNASRWLFAYHQMRSS